MIIRIYFGDLNLIPRISTFITKSQNFHFYFEIFTSVNFSFIYNISTYTLKSLSYIIDTRAFGYAAIDSISCSHFGQVWTKLIKNTKEPSCQVAHCVLFRKKGRKYYSRKIKISKLLSEAAHKQNKSVVWTILHFHPTRSWFYIKTD